VDSRVDSEAVKRAVAIIAGWALIVASLAYGNWAMRCFVAGQLVVWIAAAQERGDR